jgi:hypothetical protein
MVKYALRKYLPPGLGSQDGGESERFGNREICLDGEHGCPRSLLLAVAVT